MSDKNIGQVSILHIGSSAPENTNLVWWNSVEQIHKVYDFSLEVVKRFLKIKTDRYLRHESMILKETFPQWENKREKKSKVKRTICNSSVFVLENGNVVKKDI